MKIGKKMIDTMWVLVLFVVGVTCDVNVIKNSVSAVNTNVSDIIVNEQDGNPQVTQETVQNDVETDHGPVRGYKDESGIVQFFDIPYGYFNAESPFQEPSAPESWENVHEKSEHTSICPQIDSENNYIGNHECLTLSILKPDNAENADVLFHIHDSYFNTGSGNSSKYGPKYLVPQGIILVLPNYRLGPLGFLCMQNETAPGNAGLKDLTLALQWTKNNIKAFGGNNSNIVISGSGAAGALIEYLILSNNSRPFISKAIVESGFALSPWAIDRHPIETANTFIEKLRKNIKITDNNAYNILIQENIETLIKASHGIHFRPCVKDETGFITETPWYLLNNEKIEVTIMAGSANQAAMDKVLQQTDENLSQINQDCLLLLPNDLKFESTEEKIRIGKQVKTQYFGDNYITINDMDKLSQCYSDSKYLYPGIRGARLLAKGGATVFFYEFSYGNSYPIIGSARGDILNFVFSRDEDSIECDIENHIKDTVKDLWVSFIKSGKPSAENIEWNKLEANAEDEETWLSIGSEVQIQKGFHQSRLELWNEIYENHFVEHNLALKLDYSNYIILIGFSLSFNIF